MITEEAAAGSDRAQLARRLCARNLGVGADGMEFFEWTGPTSGRIRLHNADGSVAEISGNGTRCAAAWMAEKLDSAPGDELAVATDAGLRICRIDAVRREDGFAVEVSTRMGVPEFVPHTIRLANGMDIVGLEISTGNPHFVVFADDGDFAVAGKAGMLIGAEISGHPDFPRQTNVEFVRIVNEREIEIRIFERGVGPTMSSGTGTSAAATAALALKGCLSPLTVISSRRRADRCLEADQGPSFTLPARRPSSRAARHGKACAQPSAEAARHPARRGPWRHRSRFLGAAGTHGARNGGTSCAGFCAAPRRLRPRAPSALFCRNPRSTPLAISMPPLRTRAPAR